MNTQKPEVGKAILFAIVALVAFYICYFVLALGISLVFGLLMEIPVIGGLVEHLFRVRGDSPGILAVLLAAGVAYSAVMWIIGRFCDIKPTENLTMKIAGILLLAFNILFLIINITGGQAVFPNIVIGIAGVIMLFKGRS